MPIDNDRIESDLFPGQILEDSKATFISSSFMRLRHDLLTKKKFRILLRERDKEESNNINRRILMLILKLKFEFSLLRVF